ncbi:uncharacterized protein KIAA1671 homolog [Bombina bombina]|uniref:uncharacterized protein KIAA1671 homolog n=1 Tax=Bombina bombina TaxID=8345 RepID=UPI00235A6675|nr:uncharacterized protein KIAA1671 homolog [Bombina bombina]
MKTMATRVEITSTMTSRTAQAGLNEILNEVKLPRTLITPLSDASNKSSDSTLSSSLIIEETSRGPKSVSMFNPGARPRLSPKPFSKDKPPDWESSKFMISRLSNSSVDGKPPIDSTSQKTTIASSSLKYDDSERVNRRSFRKSQETAIEEDQKVKPEAEMSPTTNTRAQKSFSWISGRNSIEEAKLVSHGEELKSSHKPDISSKLSLISTKPEVLQLKDTVHPASSRTMPAETSREQNESNASGKNSSSSVSDENEDSSPGAVQLRPKRRPVSAMFLESISDQAHDKPKPTEEKALSTSEKSWIRRPRPLSMDLTSKFENRGPMVNKKISASEETKENIPLKKNSISTIIFEEKNQVGLKEEDSKHGNKMLKNETRTCEMNSGMSVTNINVCKDKDSEINTGKRRTDDEKQEISDVYKDNVLTKISENVNRTTKIAQNEKYVSNTNSSTSNEVQNSEEMGIAPGSIRRRISLLFANTSSSAEVTEPPVAAEEKRVSTPHQIKGLTSENVDNRLDRTMTSTQPHLLSSDFTKIFSGSPPNVELSFEKTKEMKSVFVSEANDTPKDNVDQKETFSSEKPWKTHSFKKKDPPIQSEDSANVTKEKKSSTFKKEQYDNTSLLAEKRENNIEPVETEYKTVRATVFEHKIERHNPAKIYPSQQQRYRETSKNEHKAERSINKDEFSNRKAQMEDSKSTKQQSYEDYSLSDGKKAEAHVGKATPHRVTRISQADETETSFSTESQAQKNKLYTDDKSIQRIEPRYEIFHTAGERVSSESIKMVQEEKALTLKSRQSFHRTEREESKHEMDVDFSDRPLVKLQRSKSEYRKRDTQSSTKETSSNSGSIDADIQRLKKYDLRADMSLSRAESNSYKVDRSYPTELRRENRFPERSYLKSEEYFGMPKSDSSVTGEDLKRSEQAVNLRSPIFNTSKITAGFDFEAGYKQSSKEETINRLSAEDNTKQLAQDHDFKSNIFQNSRYLAKNDQEAVPNSTNNDVTKDHIKLTVNQDIEQIKKVKEVFPKELEFMRNKSSLHNKDSNREDKISVETRSNVLSKSVDVGSTEKSRHVELKEENAEHLNTVKSSPTVDTKATYFAVTYIDNKKEKTENYFEKQGSISNTTFEDQLKQDFNIHKPYASFKNENVLQEKYNNKENLECSSALDPKTTKAESPVEDNFTTKKSEWSSRPFRPNVVDIDSLLHRSKQKTNTENLVPAYNDGYIKSSLKSHETYTAKSQESLLNSNDELEGIYKPKAIDIDALMMDYKSEHQKAKDYKISDVIEHQGESRFERSRSFRTHTEKSTNSKWKEPTVKRFTPDEGQKYESSSSYTSFEFTSGHEVKADNLKSIHHKLDSVFGDMGSAAEENNQKQEDKGSPPHTQKNRSMTTLESLLESSKRSPVRSKPDSFGVKAEKKETVHTFLKKPELVERVDYDLESTRKGMDGKVLFPAESQTCSAEQKQLQSERRRPAKTSDLVTLMLEDKQRRREQIKASPRTPSGEEQQHRTKTFNQQDWELGDNRESFISEVSRHLSTRLQEVGVSPEPFQRNRRSQHRVITASQESSISEVSRHLSTRLQEVEVAQEPFQRNRRTPHRVITASQDQLKQCFSRSPQTNKDTDTLFQDQDRHYGTWQHEPQDDDSYMHDSPSHDNITSKKLPPPSRLSSLSHTETEQHDSITDPKEGSLDRSSMDLDSTDGTESSLSFHEAKATDFSFIDQTSVLDSTALKNRVQLSRRSQRRAPTQSQRRSRILMSSSQLAVIEDTDSPWMYTDSTEEKPEKKEDSDEEEKPQRSSVQPQRMPMFPGMDPSALMNPFRKRQDPESCSESPPAQLSRSPKSPLPQGTIGVKLLPTPADKPNKGAETSSPQWLKELKSKKRQSQYENSS